MANRLFAVAAFICSCIGSIAMSAAESDCGCQPTTCEPAKSCCRGFLFHRCRQCCCDCDKEKRDRFPTKSFDPIPSAMIVDSMPVFQLTPGVVTMPMMMTGLTSGTTKAFSDSRTKNEPECSTSSNRLDDLEERVKALDIRIETIQRSVEIQTSILQEMKAERIFPQRYLPQEAPPTP